MKASDFLLEMEEIITVRQQTEITSEGFVYVRTYDEQMFKPYTAFSSSNRCYLYRTSPSSCCIIFDLTVRAVFLLFSP
jgi:hypothetical protein